jgi:thioredoxin 1
MVFNPHYLEQEPARADIDQLPGATVLEFGAPWCGHCHALEPDLADLLGQYAQVRHLRVYDGPGQPLGRSFRVKLWPCLIFLKEGQPLLQLARPTRDQVECGLQALTTGGGRHDGE